MGIESELKVVESYAMAADTLTANGFPKGECCQFESDSVRLALSLAIVLLRESANLFESASASSEKASLPFVKSSKQVEFNFNPVLFNSIAGSHVQFKRCKYK